MPFSEDIEIYKGLFLKAKVLQDKLKANTYSQSAQLDE
jgi:hypothetical protein